MRFIEKHMWLIPLGLLVFLLLVFIPYTIALSDLSYMGKSVVCYEYNGSFLFEVPIEFNWPYIGRWDGVIGANIRESMGVVRVYSVEEDRYYVCDKKYEIR